MKTSFLFVCVGSFKYPFFGVVMHTYAWSRLNPGIGDYSSDAGHKTPAYVCSHGVCESPAMSRGSTCFEVHEKWTFPEKSLTSDPRAEQEGGCQQANALLCGQLPFNLIIVTRQLLAVQNLGSGNRS